MKVNIYLDVKESDGFVFLRGAITDNIHTDQKSISKKWATDPSKTYRIMVDIPDPEAIRNHRIDVKQEAVEEIKE